jgi:hypothetical protein
VGEVVQLSFDGPTRHPPRAPKRLTWRQRQLWNYVRTYGPIHTADVRTHVDGLGALRRLERLGLVVRGFDGKWGATA